MLGGVCGGLGAYLRIDPTLIRFLFLIFILGNGIGFWLYIFMWILVPDEGSAGEIHFDPDRIGERVRDMGEDFRIAVTQPHPKAFLFIGWALISLGGVLLIKKLNISWLYWLDFYYLWPVLLILAGIILIARWRR